MAGAAEKSNLPQHETKEGNGGSQETNARGWVWDIVTFWDEEKSAEEWLKEVQNQAVEVGLVSGWAPMPLTVKVTLVSQLEVKRIRNESMSIRLPPVTVAGLREVAPSWTTKTEIGSITENLISESPPEAKTRIEGDSSG